MEKRRILIGTKTYPAISSKYRETVCTAGILLDDSDNPLQWIRIYPVRFRYLDLNKKYPRWSIITAEIEKNHRDNRPESFRINDNSIEVVRNLAKKDAWAEIKQFVLPFEFKSVGEIQSQNKSLGIIKPAKIKSSFVKETEREWSEKQRVIRDQIDFFEPNKNLEKIPYHFGYEFYNGEKTLHKYSITDWEIMQLYRNCRDNSKGKNWKTGRKKRRKK